MFTKNKIIAITIITLFAAGLFVWGGCARQEQREVDFETLSAGYYSQVSEPSHYVIEDQQEFQQVWGKIEEGSPPDINFENHMVVAVFQGEKPTGGFEITIESVIEANGRLQVYVQETAPGPDDMVTQALTYPYHMVRVDAAEKPVDFMER